MIGPPPGARVFLACGVTDMRRGMDSLAALVQQSLRTAIINDVNPQAWLTDVLERMARGEVRATELAALRHWTWRQAGTAVAA